MASLFFLPEISNVSLKTRCRAIYSGNDAVFAETLYLPKDDLYPPSIASVFLQFSIAASRQTSYQKSQTSSIPEKSENQEWSSR